MLNFKKIEIDDIEIYKKYTENLKEFSCENSFINLLVWQSKYNNMLSVNDGQLFIKSGTQSKETFHLPFSDNFEKGFQMIKEYCGNTEPEFWVQEGSSLEIFSQNHPEYILEENRDAFDYIYLRDDLAELSGKKYHSKRNHINAFSKKHNWHYEKITADNVEKVKQCAEEWYNENTDRMDEYMLCEKQGVETVLSNMERLEAMGGAIWVEHKVVAFTVGSKINNDVFDIHIEKALKDFAEGYTVINQQFAKNELSAFKYINREDDMGIEGLRRAKLSLKPQILLKKYHCKVNKI